MIHKHLFKTVYGLSAQWLGMVTFMIGLCAASLSWAEETSKNLLESINASALQGGKVQIRLNFKDALKKLPAGFTVTNPARIALDIPDTANGLGKNSLDIGEGDVRSISVVETTNRTRLVINLIRNLNYTSVLDGKALVLTIEGVPLNPAKETLQVTRFAEPVNAGQKQSLRDVDFRRGSNGEGRIVVDLSSPNAGIDIRQQGKNVLVDFISTSVPRNLIRRLDVLDFGTPVKTVDVIDQGANTRMIIEPKGLWEYSAYQTDTQFILEIKPLKEDPNKLVQGAGYNGEKLSLNFQSIEVRALLQVIADFTGLNIIATDTVGGSLTLRLKDVPWDQALDIILQSKGLSKRKNGNVVLIAPSDELITKEKLALESSNQISELEQLRTESFQLSYTKAEDVQKLISNKDQNMLSKRGKASADPRTNTLFVLDTPTKLDEIRRLIAQLDVPVRQVMIEARIVIADDKFSRELGARFGNQSGHNTGNKNLGLSGTLLNTVSPLANNPVTPGSYGISGGQLPAGAQPEQLNVNLPVAGAAGRIAATILNLGNGNLVNIELSALEADNRGKVVSNPRIVTADKKKATILQGTELPYATSSPSGGTTIQFKSAVLSLDVTPQITPDDKIIMDLEVKKDSVGIIYGGIPSIDTKNVKTQILVDNGDTAVLGGIYEQITRTDVTKVPLLGDIPFIGNLFKNTRKQEDKTELLIFITPRIIKEQLTIR